MEFTAENIEMAVHQFYQSQSGQADVNRWLTAAQVSQSAWSFASQLIQPDKSTEVQFFGANTLHAKIARFWHELSADQVEPLRSHLIQLITNFASGPRIVLTRLCVALSSFVLQTIPHQWPNAIQDLVSLFHDNPTSTNLQPAQADAILFEILTVLPEEFLTAQLQPQRCSTVRNELQKGLAIVVPLLHGYLSTSSSSSAHLVSPSVHEQALRCFSSWAQFGLPLPDSEPIISLVFSAIQNESLFDLAVDTLVSIFSHPENHRFPQSVQRMLEQVVQLNSMLQRAVTDRDMDVCQSLCRLVVMAADNNTKLLINFSFGDERQRHLAHSIVEMILQCSAMPGHYPVDERCSDFPFGFWYNFQDEILGADQEQYQTLHQMYFPVYMHLVNILLVKVRMPADEEYTSWTEEEKESHRCYRQDIADTLMYIYNLLLETMLGSLRQLFETVLDRSTKENVPWQELEAVLFAVTSLAEGINVDESVNMPAIFNLLTRIPCTNYTLVNQALYFIGAFADWMNEHPDMLGCVLPTLLRSLRDPTLAQCASMSLKDLVRECQLHLAPYASDVLVACKEVLEVNILNTRDAVRVMSCAGFVLSILPLPSIMEYLNTLLAMHLDRLRQLATAEPSANVKADIQFRIVLFGSLFLSLNTDLNHSDDSQEERLKSRPSAGDANSNPQPVLLVLQQLLPVLQLVLSHWISDSCVVADVCETLKNAVKTLLSECAPLLHDIASLISNMFQSFPHPIILDISKQILVLFSRDAEHQSTCQLLFTTLCAKTLQLLNSAAGAREYTDLLEAFMGFLAQIAKKNTDLLRSPHTCDLSGLFRTAVVGLLMHEMPTVKASCQFLCVFLALGEQYSEVNDIVAVQGQSLVDALFRAIGGEVPRANVDPMADILMALIRYHLAVLQTCLDGIAARDGFPTPRVVRDEKQQFARKVLASRMNKRKVKEVVQEYTLLWRGLLGTEYAAQTASLFGR